MSELKAGDWAVCDQRIGQLRKVDGKFAEFSDGFTCLSGQIIDQCRPLTLRSKAITESFEHRYQQLRKLDGNAGFNFPDINRYFWQLALNAIDDEQDGGKYHDLAMEFYREAREYKPVIQGVSLFRRAI